MNPSGPRRDRRCRWCLHPSECSEGCSLSEPATDAILITETQALARTAWLAAALARRTAQVVLLVVAVIVLGALAIVGWAT